MWTYIRESHVLSAVSEYQLPGLRQRECEESVCTLRQPSQRQCWRIVLPALWLRDTSSLRAVGSLVNDLTPNLFPKREGAFPLAVSEKGWDKVLSRSSFEAGGTSPRFRA